MNRAYPFLLATLAATSAHAAGSGADPRIRHSLYDPDRVTELRGCPGFQSTIAFAPEERIENIALGDADMWQAVPNKRSDLLFVKPTGHNGHTNMTVVTDRHRYDFDLVVSAPAACRAGHIIYDMRFTYPQEPKPTLAELVSIAPPPPASPAVQDSAPPPAQRNTAYSFTGTSANVPMRVFDDGKSTWMHWADGVAAPAVYALGPDKQESLVNYSMRGDYMVVDGVAPAFVLRRGPAVATLYNDAYQQPRLDAAAPRPRGAPGRHSMFAGLFGSSSSQDSRP